LSLVSSSHKITLVSDGKSDAYFASKSAKGWVGYDLGEPYVIAKISYIRVVTMDGKEYKKIVRK